MRQTLLVLTLAALGCDDGAPLMPATPAMPAGAAAPAIALGADGVGTDRADYDCRIALVSAGRVNDGRGGYEVDCAGGPCRWRIAGELAVSGDGVPHILYRTSETGRWLAVAAELYVPDVDGGTGRYRFALTEGTPRPDYSGTALSRSKIELIPYLALPDGGRLFDHNRLPDPFASYELAIGNGFAIERDTSCAPTQRLAEPGPDDRVVDWAGNIRLYRARAGDTVALAEPFDYQGFSNMGFAVELSVYAEGLTQGAWVDTSKIKVFFESDLMSCEPGGERTVIEVPLAQAGGGPYGNDAIYRQPIEPMLTRCPRGTYRHRLWVSADGGKTGRPLGLGADLDAPEAAEFRTIHYD